MSETQLDKRGFHSKSPAARELLETVGEYFLTGYGHAVGARSVTQAVELLEEIPLRFRGFAYEGAGMGYAVLDGLPFGGRRRVADLLTAEGERHGYIIYVGVGWAMARLPRWRWPSPDEFDPLLRWLVLDGYGFHQAYFHTAKYVHKQYQDPAFPWPGGACGQYASHAIDQGIGRALWFVCGTDVDLVVRTIEKFPETRRGDLYSGVGLASTYACGADEDQLRELAERAGPHRGQLAQGSAFAAEARVRAGLLIPETRTATLAICGLPPDRAAAITQEVRPARPVDTELPAFGTWRRRIADEVLSLGGVSS